MLGFFFSLMNQIFCFIVMSTYKYCYIVFISLAPQFLLFPRLPAKMMWCSYHRTENTWYNLIDIVLADFENQHLLIYCDYF